MPFDKAIWPGFLLSQLCVVLTFIAVWRYVTPHLGNLRALLAILFLEGIYYYNFTSPEFNSNVSLLPLWAWTAYVFYRALKRESFLHWVVFGLMMGLCVLSKYASLVWGGVFAMYLLCTPHGRSWLTRPGPYISLIVFAVVISPHVKWLLAHDAQTLTYLAERSGVEALQWWDRFIFPVDFTLAQLGALSPMVFLFLSFRKKFFSQALFSQGVPEAIHPQGWEQSGLKYRQRRMSR